MELVKFYFIIVLFSVFGLAFVMMGNNVMWVEGVLNMVMFMMMVLVVVNLILDLVFIVWLDWGIEGVVWAIILFYYVSGGFMLWFFFLGRLELMLYWSSMVFD